MKGLDKLKEKLPDYKSKTYLKFLIVAFTVFFSSLLFQLIFDSLPRIFREIALLQILAPLTPIFGKLIIFFASVVILESSRQIFE
jgi:hypothetical protein